MDEALSALNFYCLERLSRWRATSILAVASQIRYGTDEVMAWENRHG
jgi:hypothetical protein